MTSPVQSSYQVWQQALNTQLVRRLWRPVERPGLIRPQLARAIAVRHQSMTQQLSLAEQLGRRAEAQADLSTDMVPIVYAQPTPLLTISGQPIMNQSHTTGEPPPRPVVSATIAHTSSPSSKLTWTRPHDISDDASSASDASQTTVVQRKAVSGAAELMISPLVGSETSVSPGPVVSATTTHSEPDLPKLTLPPLPSTSGPVVSATAAHSESGLPELTLSPPPSTSQTLPNISSPSQTMIVQRKAASVTPTSTVTPSMTTAGQVPVQARPSAMPFATAMGGVEGKIEAFAQPVAQETDRAYLPPTESRLPLVFLNPSLRANDTTLHPSAPTDIPGQAVVRVTPGANGHAATPLAANQRGAATLATSGYQSPVSGSLESPALPRVRPQSVHERTARANLLLAQAQGPLPLVGVPSIAVRPEVNQLASGQRQVPALMSGAAPGQRPTAPVPTSSGEKHPSPAPIDIDRIVDQVHRKFMRTLAIEGERRRRK